MKKELNILCIADHVDPLIYSEGIKKHFSHVDAVISCGDLKKYYYEFIVSNLNVPLLYVLGNHSPFSLEKPNPIEYSVKNLFQGGILTDGKCIYIKELDLIVAGLGGCIRHNNGKNQYTEAEMFFRIILLLPQLLLNKIIRGRCLDIFMTHSPPRHINDREDPCHRGFKVFRLFLRIFKPRYMLHGHVHLYKYNDKRKETFKTVPIINVYDHYILKIPPKGE